MFVFVAKVRSRRKAHCDSESQMSLGLRQRQSPTATLIDHHQHHQQQQQQQQQQLNTVSSTEQHSSSPPGC